MTLRWLVFAGALAMASLAARASAQNDPEAEARARFEAGRDAFLEARWDDAMSAFEDSYRLSGRAELLYNIGSAAERAGQLERARDAYGEYLRAMPEAPNRAEAEARRGAVMERLAGRQALDQPREGPQPVSLPNDGPGVLPWIVIAGSAVVAVTGAVLLVLGQMDNAKVEDATRGTTWAEVQAAYDRGPVLSTTGVIMVAAGVAGAAAGVALLVLGSADEEGQTQVRFGPGSVDLAVAF